MLARHLSDSVPSEAAQDPVVTLMGPRQSGKTTLCQMLFPDHEPRLTSRERIALYRADTLANGAVAAHGLLNRAPGERGADGSRLAPSFHPALQHAPGAVQMVARMHRL